MENNTSLRLINNLMPLFAQFAQYSVVPGNSTGSDDASHLRRSGTNEETLSRMETSDVNTSAPDEPLSIQMLIKWNFHQLRRYSNEDSLALFSNNIFHYGIPRILRSAFLSITDVNGRLQLIDSFFHPKEFGLNAQMLANVAQITAIEFPWYKSLVQCDFGPLKQFSYELKLMWLKLMLKHPYSSDFDENAKNFWNLLRLEHPYSSNQLRVRNESLFLAKMKSFLINQPLTVEMQLRRISNFGIFSSLTGDSERRYNLSATVVDRTEWTDSSRYTFDLSWFNFTQDPIIFAHEIASLEGSLYTFMGSDPREFIKRHLKKTNPTYWSDFSPVMNLVRREIKPYYQPMSLSRIIRTRYWLNLEDVLRPHTPQRTDTIVNKFIFMIMGSILSCGYTRGEWNEYGNLSHHDPNHPLHRVDDCDDEERVSWLDRA